MGLKNPPTNPLAKTIGRILPDTCVDFGEAYLTSGEHAMSDRNVWKIIITLVVLFCAGVGIWFGVRAKDYADLKYKAKTQYESMQMSSKREFDFDMKRYESGLTSLEAVFARDEARKKEISDFWENNRILLRD